MGVLFQALGSIYGEFPQARTGWYLEVTSVYQLNTSVNTLHGVLQPQEHKLEVSV